MGNDFFNAYPYTDFHELNLSWVVRELRSFATTLEHFVSINALKYANPIQWDITRQYEKNTIVIDPLTGTAYISVQEVPAGVALTRDEYWTVVFNLGSFITRAAKNFTSKYEPDTTLTATFNTNAGEWLVWGDVLYVATVNITAGDSYVVDRNIRHITMEEIKNTIIGMIGNLSALSTQDKDNLVAAINEVIYNYQVADQALAENLSAEATARIAAINQLTTDYQTSDQALAANIAAEVTNRTNADNQIIHDYQVDDIALAQNITAEVNNRIAEDNAIRDYIKNITYDYVVDVNGSGDFTSLATCVSTVPTGSVILVKAGTYNNEVVSALGKKLTIIGENKDTVIIQNDYDDYYRPPLSIASGFVSDITFISTGTGGGTPAYAVHIDFDDLYNDTLIFNNCDFTSNTTVAAGIGTRNNGKLIFNECTFTTNTNSTGAVFIHPAGSAAMGGSNQLVTFMNCVLHARGTTVLAIEKVGAADNYILATFIGTQLLSDTTGTRFGYIYRSGSGSGDMYFTQGAGNNYSMLNQETFVPGQQINTGRYVNQVVRKISFTGTLAAGGQQPLTLPSDAQTLVSIGGYATRVDNGMSYPLSSSVGGDYYHAFCNITNKVAYVGSSQAISYYIEVEYVSNSPNYC